MELLPKLARIASIPLLVATGCTTQEQVQPEAPPKRQPLVIPPSLDQPLPRPPEPQREAHVAKPTPVRQSGSWVNLSNNGPPQKPPISVPADTRDPKLVEIGVQEWLDARPEYTLPHKIAILHRMRQESSFNPCAENGAMKYLLQWRDDRLKQLYRATHVRPGTCPSWLSQMAFMDTEIKHDPRWASFFGTRTKQAAYKVFTSVYLVGVLGSYP